MNGIATKHLLIIKSKINSIRRGVRLRQIQDLHPVELQQNGKKSGRIVVSMTSYGERIHTVHYAIRSLFDQLIRPDVIVLWLSSDSDSICLPNELTELQKYGLRIVRGCSDLKGHKKYWYAMQEYSDDYIVTVDDDLIYPKNMILSLVKYNTLYPRSVIARRVHRICVSGNHVAKYAEWEKEWYESRPIPRKSLMATTGAGTLYCPYMYKYLLKTPEEIINNALLADDIWLKAAEAAAGINVVFAKNHQQMPFELSSSKGNGLCLSNVNEGGNDRALDSVVRFFALDTTAFIDE